MKRKAGDSASEQEYGQDDVRQAREPADREDDAPSESEEVGREDQEEAFSAEEGSSNTLEERKRCRMACMSCWERKLRCTMLKNGSCLKCVERNRPCVPRVHNRRPSGRLGGRYRLPTDGSDVIMSVSALAALGRAGCTLPTGAYSHAGAWCGAGYSGNMANAMMTVPSRPNLGLDPMQMAYFAMANPSLGPSGGLSSSVGQYVMLETGAPSMQAGPPMHSHMMPLGRGMPGGVHMTMSGQHNDTAIYQLPIAMPLNDEHVSMMLRRPDPSFYLPQQPVMMAPHLYSLHRHGQMQQPMRMPPAFGGSAGAPAPYSHLYGQMHGQPHMEPQVLPFELPPLRLQMPIPAQMAQHVMPHALAPVRPQVSVDEPPSAQPQPDPHSTSRLESSPAATP
jgi:hypothetical protein